MAPVPQIVQVEGLPNAGLPPVPTIDAPGMTGQPVISEASTPADIGSAYGTTYGSNPGVVLDEVNPYNEDGSPNYRNVTADELAQEQQRQAQSQLDMRDAMMSGDSINTPRNILEASNKAAERMDLRTRDPRVNYKPFTEQQISDWSAQAQGPFMTLTNDTHSALFNNTHPHSVTYNDEGRQGMAVGQAFMEKYGLFDYSEEGQKANTENANAIGRITALAMSSAINQANNADIKVREKGVEKDRPDGYTPEVDFINAGTAAAMQLFKRMNFDPSPKDVNDLMAASMSYFKNAGLLTPFRSRQGQMVLAAVGSLKDRASALGHLVEVSTGQSQRKFPSSVPNPTGASFHAGGTHISEDSKHVYGDLETPAADAAKDAMGRVAGVFLTEDMDYKEAELKMVLENKDPTLPFSHHPLAHRLRLSESDYKARKAAVKPSLDYDPSNPASVDRWNKAQESAAQDLWDSTVLERKAEIQNARMISARQPRWYPEYQHSAANGRFTMMSAGVDTMSSKVGTREMANFEVRDYIRANSLFDVGEIARLKTLGKSLFTKYGTELNDAMAKLPPSDLGAIAAMINATSNYYNMTGNVNKKVSQMSNAEILDRYDVNVANRMAELGRDYMAFLTDAQDKLKTGQAFGDQSAFSNILGYLNGMPKGEALGNKNLWADFFKAQQLMNQPGGKNRSFTTTYVAYSDGKQNGIFWQSLFFGSGPTAVRLGTVNPDMGDMRDLAMQYVGDGLEASVSDPDKLNGWRGVMGDLVKTSFGNDMFKAILMRNSYSQDAGSFGTHVLDVLQDEDYFPVIQKYLLDTNLYTDLISASEDFNSAVEKVVSRAVDQTFSRMMRIAGRFSAILDEPINSKTLTGDPMILAPVSLKLKMDGSSQETSIMKGDNTVLLRKRGHEMIPMSDQSGNDIGVASASRTMDPSASKKNETYFNRGTNTFHTSDNYFGTALERQNAVLPIQHADAAAVILTMLNLNSKRIKNGDAPRPVLFNHDAINAPGSSALFYNNTYNNVAIPQMMRDIPKFGMELWNSIQQSRSKVLAEVHDNGQPVGIGSSGEYPALGAYFDEIYHRIQDGGSNYFRYFKRKGWDIENNPQAKGVDPELRNKIRMDWDKYKAEREGILKQARQNGWTDDHVIDESNRQYLAVLPSQFKALVNLAGSYMGVLDSEESAVPKFQAFADAFKQRSEEAARQLTAEATRRSRSVDGRNIAGGYQQMSGTSGGKEKPFTFVPHTEVKGNLDTSTLPSGFDIKDPKIAQFIKRVSEVEDQLHKGDTHEYATKLSALMSDPETKAIDPNKKLFNWVRANYSPF
jgi:hypothetical protein